MKIGTAAETFPGERRVAMVPDTVPALIKTGLEVLIETGAGERAGFGDQAYRDKGAQIVPDRRTAQAADIVVQVRCGGVATGTANADLGTWRGDQVLIGMCDPLGFPAACQRLAETGVTLMALELVPRITRAQSMDVLSSMATVAGYRAVLLAALELPRMFPLLMTAAGTLKPARVFVIGAGVAGLQAMATARRLGAIVQAYDVRAAAKEQVESVGARFVQMELKPGDAEDRGGYAKAMDEAFYEKQRQLMASVVAESDVVITTAAIPGKASPRLVTAEAVHAMRPGSVIVDLAAERGGNCELTKADQRLVAHGVTILGPTNLPAEIPYHASLMFAKNITHFVQNIVRDGTLQWSADDEIIRDSTVARGGQITHPRVRELLGLGPTS